MAKWGMVIDLDKCVGCQACVVACKSENNVPHGSPKEQQRMQEIFWHKVIAACIGCKYCIVACPYGSRSFNYKEQEKEEYNRPDLPPDLGLDTKTYIGPWPFPHRTHGVVEKCTFCFHRIDQAKKRIKAGENIKIGIDVVPACVEACPAEARAFGDLDDPESTVSRLLASRDWFKLRKDMGTEPKVIYLPR
jgi:Fe-S-cluster-containing dehydrogenase component